MTAPLSHKKYGVFHMDAVYFLPGGGCYAKKAKKVKKVVAILAEAC